MLRVKNTLTHSIEPFVPREPGVVRMYVCGPSVYDESHLGHARSYVAYDAIKRTLQKMGNRVIHVQNFTDVEENISQRAAKAGVSPLAFADKIIQHFFRDMDELRIQRADHYPRVSDHIAEIKTIIADLCKKDLAYAGDCAPRVHTKGGPCDVYFNARDARDFGALIGTNIDELAVEHPVEIGERKSALDFALWKSRNDWGITWPSPWGPGRPGWHVECTAMATKYLGADFDIHGGGLDLVFPHHESERAVGEAWTGQRYCKYYLHNGFVTVGDQKMSKSMGNFVTIRTLLDTHDPEALRVLLLSAHYRAPINYSEASIETATKRVQKWREGIARLRAAPPGGAAPKAQAAFWAALEDDFQFGRALDAIDLAFDEEADPVVTLEFLKDASEALGVLWEISAAYPPHTDRSIVFPESLRPNSSGGNA